VRREITRASLSAALATAAGMSVGPTPMVSAVAGLFMGPLSKEFALSRTLVSTILLMSPVTVALCSPIGGRLLDRFGVRRVLLPAVALFALANAAMLLAHALWQYVALATVIAACTAVHCYSSYTKVLSLWFARRRGIMTGLMIAGGSGLGAVIAPQLVSRWLVAYGWRGAYAAMACVVVLWGLPILFLFLREPGGAIAASPSTRAPAAAARPGVTQAEALRTPTFWLIALAMMLATWSIVGTLAHAFPMLTERGVSPGLAAATLSFVYVGGMIGQLTSGWLLDRVGSPRIVLPYFAFALVGIAVVHHASTRGLLLPGAVLLGLGQGSEMSILAYLASRYFGLKAYGGVYGALYGFANFGIAAGILSMGVVHDLAGGYGPMGYLLPVSMGAVVALFAILPPYRYPREAGGPALA